MLFNWYVHFLFNKQPGKYYFSVALFYIELDILVSSLSTHNPVILLLILGIKPIYASFIPLFVASM